MDLYTLTDTFLANEPVDDFVSAIWTERYSIAGDCQLVVPATQELIDKLAPGTYLALRGTKEVMNLETQSIEKGMMTVIGNTLPKFLNERYAWFQKPVTLVDAPKIIDYTDETRKPGEFIAHVIDKMVINPVPMVGGYDTANLDWPNEIIPNLTLGPVDTSGDVKRLTIPIGPLYDGISQIADKEGVGISLYLDSADPITGYVLKFTTYRGRDLTSDQSTYPLVRLVPELDSISDIKEIRSNSMYKNVAYVYLDWDVNGTVSTHLAEPSLPTPEGFDRRVLVVNPSTENTGYGSGGYIPSEELTAFREQSAKDALANANYINTIDGQTSPQNDYKFGVDYGLGDTIELEGLTGTISKSRVIEYIRSQDKTGEREYPTISVVT